MLISLDSPLPRNALTRLQSAICAPSSSRLVGVARPRDLGASPGSTIVLRCAPLGPTSSTWRRLWRTYELHTRPLKALPPPRSRHSRGVCPPLGMSPLLVLDICPCPCPCPALPLHFFLSYRGDWVRPPTPLLPPRNRFSSPWVRGFSVWSCSNHALFPGSQLAAGSPRPPRTRRKSYMG